MQDARDDLHKDADTKSTVNKAVSCDGSWHRWVCLRGDSSQNSVITVISMKNEKVLDVER